jgi:hypothetical protein
MSQEIKSIQEEWSPHPLYPEYNISSYGKIKKGDRLLSIETTPNGYYRVFVRGRMHYVHNLVADTYIGPKPDGYITHHIDYIKTNNFKLNLQYMLKGTHVKEHNIPHPPHMTSIISFKREANKIGISLEKYLSNRMIGLKRCWKCCEWKPITDFPKDRSRYDGLNAVCFICLRERRKLHREFKRNDRPRAD